MVVERIVSVCSHQNFQILNYFNLNIILVLKWSFLFAYSNSIPYVMVNHTLRKENQCADFFAKLGASYDVDFLRHESSPVNLKNLLESDVTGIFFLRE